MLERLGNSILTLFDNDVSYSASSNIDIEFQSWFGLQSHVSATPTVPADVSIRTDVDDYLLSFRILGLTPLGWIFLLKELALIRPICWSFSLTLSQIMEKDLIIFIICLGMYRST